METVAPDRDLIHQAPKVVLHDHLDGGLRPTTVVELADLTGYRDLPTTDPAELATWFRRGADRRDLGLYLETFDHTCLLYTSPSPRDGLLSRMPSSA